MNLPYAQDINYWKTSKASPDTWQRKTQALIEKIGGNVIAQGWAKMGADPIFLIEFTFGNDLFRIIWPVLPTKYENDERASMPARERQAVTLIYHEVKSRLLRASIFGPKTAFFDFMTLEDGRTVSQLARPDLAFPKLLTE